MAGITVEIGDPVTDYIYFANHTDSLGDGNWLELSGGTEVTIPSIEASYEGVEDTIFEIDGTPVNVTTGFFNGETTVTYPLDTHTIYIDGGDDADVVAKFHGQNELAYQTSVSFRLISATVSEWRDAYTDLITEADPDPLKDLIQNPYLEVHNNLDNDGDADDIQFNSVTAGDYILVALLEDDSDPYNLIVLSATPVEVLEYDLSVDFDSSFTRGDELEIDFEMTDADHSGSYTYGAAIIRSSVYDIVVEAMSNGTMAGTNVTVNDELVLEGEGTVADDPSFNFVGFDIDSLNTGDLTDLLANVFGEKSIAVGFDEDDYQGTTVSIDTDSMYTGEYILLMGVWDSNGDKLVAFAQDTVTMKSTSSGDDDEDLPTVDEIEEETPEDAADTLVDLDPSDAADIIEELSTSDAAAIIEEMDTDDAADILLETDSEAAAKILEETTPEDAAAIVESVIDSGDLSDFIQILLDMQDESAAEVLNVLGTSYGAAVVEEMATRDLNEAAKTVEEAVKLFTSELDPDTQETIREHVKDTLKDVTVETLVELFIEIANLPQTPSTVAEIFEILDFAQVMDVVTGMGGAGAWEELGKVFEYLSTETLGKIYTAMTEEQRDAVSPYLTAATVARLPQLYAFTTSDLTITPATVKVGESVTVTAKVTNTGSAAGSYDVVLKVNSVSTETKTVSLNAGASTTVSFTVTGSAAGTYSVAIDSLSGSFTVKTPAAFTVSNLQISSTEVDAGEEVTVTVTISNTGDLSGSYALSVKLDGVEKYSESVTVDGASSTTKTYTLSSSVEGEHTVTVDGLSVEFTVKTTTQPPTTPDYTLYIVAVLAVVLIVAAYFLVIKKKSP